MPFGDCLALMEKLRPCGYRPVRFRPFAAGDAVQAAALWARDGGDWRLAHGLTAEAASERDAAYRKEGLAPIDLAAYGQNKHALLWAKATESDSTQLAVGLEDAQFNTRVDTLREQGYWCVTATASIDGTKLSAIWSKPAARKPPTPQESTDTLFRGMQVEYEAIDNMADLQMDLRQARASRPPTTKERSTQQLAQAQKKLQAKADDPDARLERARARVGLGRDDDAIEDLSWYLTKFPDHASALQLRAIVYARLGRAKEAADDLARFTKVSDSASQKVYTDAVVAANLGQDEAGMKRLEAAVATRLKDKEFLYDAACAFAIAAAVFEPRDRAKSKSFAARAVELLQQAVGNGYAEFGQMNVDDDLDSIRELPTFKALTASSNLDLSYLAIWHPVTGFESLEIHGLGAAEHLAKCSELSRQGYRLASLSAFQAQSSVTTASVWRRPLVLEDNKETLAKRQANAACALLDLGRPEQVWPLFKHSPDPRVRSYLIHALAPRTIDPRQLMIRLEEEQAVDARRALVLALGEFGEQVLPLGARAAWLPKLLDIYRREPDPGLRASASWLLLKWGRKTDLAAIDKELAARPRKPAPEADQPGWYLNSLGQTMIVLPAPRDYVMGSLRGEEGREGGTQNRMETLHHQRIGRKFALAAHEVTVDQFLELKPGHQVNGQFARTGDAPVDLVDWYQAAEYCDLLSAREKIPPNQWCYEKNSSGRYAEGMKLKANYLDLQGYRLPTEAEWEYACRAGAVASRYYGQSEELLPMYAWYTKNSQDRWMLPVGSLKPNDFGFFDMLGNAQEWTQDESKHYVGNARGFPVIDRAETEDINDRRWMLLRGGSFFDQAVHIRSAYRCRALPTSGFDGIGFRPARTFTP